MLGFKHSILFVLLVLFVFCKSSYCQTELTLPKEFQNLSVNSRALNKQFQFTLDSSTTGTSQNFVLDKTGFILHMVPSTKIKNENAKIKIFSSDGAEVQTYPFLDGTTFALVDPQKTYSIYEEIIPSCDDLIMVFGSDRASAVCPDTELFKLYENIMLDKDTSFKIGLKVPQEFYSTVLSLPEETKFFMPGDFSNINISLANAAISSVGVERSPINIASLLTLGRLCFVSKKKISGIPELTNCSLVNSNVSAVITFKNSFIDKDISMITPNLLFSFISGRFNAFSHSYVFEFAEDIKSKNKIFEITGSSLDKYFFENNSSNFSLNLGQIPTVLKKNRKNIFTLTSPIELNKTLNDVSFSLPVNNTGAIFSLALNDMSFDVFLNNISLDASDDLLNVYNLSAGNNIVIKNLLEPDVPEVVKQKLQTSAPDTLVISSYLPDKFSNLTLSRDYTFAEQNIAPSVDDKGKPIQIINNKSRADIILSKDFSNIDLSNQTRPFELTVGKTSTLLNNKSFTMQGNLTGFLTPPDFRPVLENGYRANIEFTMSINLANTEVLKIIYIDLKTKDETPLTNFFSFSFLPFGKYDVNLEFDADRTKLFQSAGLVKSDK